MQFRSSEQQTPPWSSVCQRFIRETPGKDKGGSRRQEGSPCSPDTRERREGRAPHPHCRVVLRNSWPNRARLGGGTRQWVEVTRGAWPGHGTGLKERQLEVVSRAFLMGKQGSAAHVCCRGPLGLPGRCSTSQFWSSQGPVHSYQGSQEIFLLTIFLQCPVLLKLVGTISSNMHSKQF